MSQYLKPDCELGYIEDQAEIEKLKVDNLRHTILGCMLGDFVETGAYVVEPEIVQELIEMPKYIVETMDNIEICKSTLKLDNQITFAVTFEGNKATLSLLEKLSYEANFAINSGTYSNINEYVLDTVETSGEINRNAIYTRWNIGEFGGSVVDIFNCDPEVFEKYFGIVNRFKYLLYANKVLLEKEEQIEEAEASYANEIFEILKHYPKLQNEVMKQIKSTLNEKKDAISLNKPNFAKTFNELLDNVIKSNLSVLDEQQKQDFETEKRNATVNLNVKRSEILETENVDIDKTKDVDLQPKVIKFKTDNLHTSKSITELGEEFVSAHKFVMDKKKDKTEKVEDNQGEKDKLVATLIGAGLGAVIGGGVGAVVGAAAGNLVAEVAEKVNANKDVSKGETSKPNVKKDAGKKAGGKLAGKSADGGKKTGGGKSSSGGGKSSGGKKTGGKDDKSKNDTKNQETTTSRRLFPVMTGQPEKEEIKIPKMSKEDVLKMEEEIAKREKAEKIEKAITGNVKAEVIVTEENAKVNVDENIVVEQIKKTTIIKGVRAGVVDPMLKNKTEDLEQDLTLN